MIDKSTRVDPPGRGQQNRIPALTGIGINALKPMLYFQVSMLRIWADNIERFAGRYEQAVDETAATIVAEQSEKERAA